MKYVLPTDSACTVYKNKEKLGKFKKYGELIRIRKDYSGGLKKFEKGGGSTEIAKNFTRILCFKS
jgi:hypothetical protein